MEYEIVISDKATIAFRREGKILNIKNFLAAIVFYNLILGSSYSWAEGMEDWSVKVSLKIRQNIRTPVGYNHLPIPLRVAIKFEIDRNGRVGDLVVTKGSGLWDLDDAVIQAVRAAQPLPVPPLPLSESSSSVILPITFQ